MSSCSSHACCSSGPILYTWLRCSCKIPMGLKCKLRRERLVDRRPGLMPLVAFVATTAAHLLTPPLSVLNSHHPSLSPWQTLVAFLVMWPKPRTKNSELRVTINFTGWGCCIDMSLVLAVFELMSLNLLWRNNIGTKPRANHWLIYITDNLPWSSSTVTLIQSALHILHVCDLGVSHTHMPLTLKVLDKAARPFATPYDFE